MKKSLFALSVLGVFTGATHAQSSVTLFGLIDEGLNYTNNAGGHSLHAMWSGDAQGPRWGLKGTEDLGDGLSTVFQLENGFSVNNGKPGQEFGRQAFVGLSSATLGTLTLGRQNDSVVDDLAPLTVNRNWSGQIFSHPYDNDNTGNTFRVNNSTNFAINRAESVRGAVLQWPLVRCSRLS